MSLFPATQDSGGKTIRVTNILDNIVFDYIPELKLIWRDTSGGGNQIKYIPSPYFGTLAWCGSIKINVKNNDNIINIELGTDVYNRMIGYGSDIKIIMEYTKATD